MRPGPVEIVSAHPTPGSATVPRHDQHDEAPSDLRAIDHQGRASGYERGLKYRN